MPLIVLTGFPSSGKTTRALQFVQHFESVYPQKSVVVVSDDQFSGFNKDIIYSHSQQEKSLRGYLKSEVQKHLNKDTIVILDSLNYIKGYRYELYCVTKSAQTPHCVIWCDISKENSKIFNNSRSENERYSDRVLDELVMRYEEPISGNRWDSPLFVVQVNDELCFSDIDDALFKSKPPAPNLSTVAQPLQPTNFMYELDKITSDIVKNIVNQQKTAVPGQRIQIPNAQEIQLTRHLTLAELNKNRRQFVTYMKMNPLTDCTKIPSTFVQYLQQALK